MSLVRSLQEFGSVVWNPTKIKLISKLEAIQRKATNIILNNPPWWTKSHKNYRERLLECNLLPLTFRREITDIIFFLKSLNSYTGFISSDYFQFQTNRGGMITRNQKKGLTLKIPTSKYAATAQLYPPRLAKLWNTLPIPIRGEIVTLSKPDQIKRILIPYYWRKFDTYFDSENTCTWVHVCYCPKCAK